MSTDDDPTDPTLLLHRMRAERGFERGTRNIATLHVQEYAQRLLVPNLWDAPGVCMLATAAGWFVWWGVQSLGWWTAVLGSYSMVPAGLLLLATVWTAMRVPEKLARREKAIDAATDILRATNRGALMRVLDEARTVEELSSLANRMIGERVVENNRTN